MRNARRAPVLVSAALWLICALFSTPIWADEFVSVPFVPAFSGAVSLEATLSNAFTFRASNLDAPPSLLAGAALGYHWMFDPHGATSLRFRAYAEHSVESLSGAMWAWGGDFGFYLRGYDPQFLYGGVGVFAGAGGTQWESPKGDVTGWRLNLGAETNFGMLWFLSPYLFGELAARASFEVLDLGALTDQRVLVTWALRFDWAWVERDWVEPEVPRPSPPDPLAHCFVGEGSPEAAAD